MYFRSGSAKAVTAPQAHLQNFQGRARQYSNLRPSLGISVDILLGF
jgi:hypothetical protein